MPQASLNRAAVRAVLFDLDGTLIDSAPDLAGAANELRLARGLPELAYEQLRPLVGAGARGMVGVAMGVVPGDAEFADLRDEFLRRYQARMVRATRIFEAVHVLLSALEARAVTWGIVTNKAERFTFPILDALGLAPRAAAVVCGDTTPHSKPHPAPLLEAARRLDLPAGQCVYVGDDLRDVQAGHAAGMAAVVAGWGYLGLGEPVDRWNADAIISEPAELLNFLQIA